jgi:hypothetical protein
MMTSNSTTITNKPTKNPSTGHGIGSADVPTAVGWPARFAQPQSPCKRRMGFTITRRKFSREELKVLCFFLSRKKTLLF